jgi:hypothetical protein
MAASCGLFSLSSETGGTDREDARSTGSPESYISLQRLVKAVSDARLKRLLKGSGGTPEMSSLWSS